MNITKLYEIASTDKRLNNLGLAIAEAKMTHNLLRKKANIRNPDDQEKLEQLEQRIDEMETTLFELEAEDRQPL